VQIGERDRNRRARCCAELFVVRQKKTPDRFERLDVDPEFACLQAVPRPLRNGFIRSSQRDIRNALAAQLSERTSDDKVLCEQYEVL
jgi:hypothetical protein